MTKKRLDITPSQTIGPFFAFSLTPADYTFSALVGPRLADDGVPGTKIILEGRVIDGDGAAVIDAMVEIWQADHAGQYAAANQSNHNFSGFGRSETRQDGKYHFDTIKPGKVSGKTGSVNAPHVSIGIFARGITKRLHTRIYFDDESDANAIDPVLALVPEARRSTLIAKKQAGSNLYRLDIYLQGENETVFFDA